MTINKNIENLKNIYFNPIINLNKQFDFVGFGLNAIDYLIEVEQFPSYNTKSIFSNYKVAPGGQTASAMLALKKWGLKTKYIGKIGDDEASNIAINSLKIEGVDITDMKREKNTNSQIAFIIVDKSNGGERTIMWNRGEKLNYSIDEINENQVNNTNFLFLDGHNIEASNKAIDIAKENNSYIIADLDRIHNNMIEHTKKLIL